MHEGRQTTHRALTDVQQEQFLHDGFVKLENVFSTETAAEARAILWRDTGCDPDDAYDVDSSGHSTHRLCTGTVS